MPGSHGGRRQRRVFTVLRENTCQPVSLPFKDEGERKTPEKPVPNRPRDPSSRALVSTQRHKPGRGRRGDASNTPPDDGRGPLSDTPSVTPWAACLASPLPAAGRPSRPLMGRAATERGAQGPSPPPAPGGGAGAAGLAEGCLCRVSPRPRPQGPPRPLLSLEEAVFQAASGRSPSAAPAEDSGKAAGTRAPLQGGPPLQRLPCPPGRTPVRGPGPVTRQGTSASSLSAHLPRGGDTCAFSSIGPARTAP